MNHKAVVMVKCEGHTINPTSALAAIIPRKEEGVFVFVLFLVNANPLGNLQMVLSPTVLTDISHQTGLVKDGSPWGGAEFLLWVWLAHLLVAHWQTVVHSKKHLEAFVEPRPRAGTALDDGGIQGCTIECARMCVVGESPLGDQQQCYLFSAGLEPGRMWPSGDMSGNLKMKLTWHRAEPKRWRERVPKQRRIWALYQITFEGRSILQLFLWDPMNCLNHFELDFPSLATESVLNVTSGT